MPPKTRAQKRRETEGAETPVGGEGGDVIVPDPSLNSIGGADGGKEQRERRHRSSSASEGSCKSEASESLTKSMYDSFDDLIKKIESLETLLTEIKSKRSLQLMDETEQEEAMAKEIAQIAEDRIKLDDDDPAYQEMGEKLEKKNKEFKTFSKEAKLKEIEYERVYSLKTTQLNFYRNKLYSLQRREENRTGDSLSSLSSSKRLQATKAWVDGQRRTQEAEDFQVAKKLQEEINQQQQDIEQKKKKLHNLKVGSVIVDDLMPPPPPRTKEADNQQTLSALIARQSSNRELPFFDGRPEQWVRFKTVFNRTTRNCQFSDEENLMRLEKCLKGEALTAVRSLMFTETNVPAIMKKLEKIFGNPEIIIDNLIEEVERLPPVKDGRPEALVEFGTAVVNLTATLESLGRREHLCNPIMVKNLQKKLPYQEELRWIKYSKLTGRDLLAFSEWIEEEVEDARMSGHARGSKQLGSFERREKESRNNNKFQKNSGRCLASADKPEDIHKDRKKFSRDNKSCFFCDKEGHFASKCKLLLNKKPEDRFQLVMDKKLCTACLIPGHRMKECRRKKACGENGCRKEHHLVLHKEESLNSKESEPMKKEVTEEIHSLNSGGDTHMGALPVVLSGPDGEIECLAFIDSGSTVTLLKEDIAEQLGLKGPRQPFCLKTLNSDKRHGSSRVTSLGIRGIWKKAKIFSVDGVRTVEEMPIGRLTQDAGRLKEKYPFLQQVQLPTFINKEPGILIGMREIHLFDTIKSVGSDPGAPRAMKCPLGWRLGGMTSRKSDEAMFHTCHHISVEDSLTELVRKSFTTEDFGVKAAPTPQSKEDQMCQEIMERTTRRVPGTTRFETGLLWRDSNVVLPESRQMALHRLQCQEKKMDRDAAFAKAYCSKINENMGKGFYRKLTPEEAAKRTAKTWYLPHFGVWNPNKPGKIRLVMDAKAKSRGISLNDVLMRGPDLNNSLLGVLLRFRQFMYAYAGDIKDMYHRVFIKEDERCSQRFLWRNMRRDVPPDEYEMIVLTFASTCSPASAQFVKNKNAEENREEYPEASKAIIEDMYVDDELGSKPTMKAARKVVKDIVTVNAKAGFVTCNWNANFSEILEDIDDDLKCVEIMEISERDEDAAERVLGLWWDSRKDEFTFRLKMFKVPREILEKKRRPTKRDVLRVTMSVFDPLGFVAHLSIKPKILIQSLWTKGIGWDDEIPDDLLLRWDSWLDELKQLSNVRIPRCYSVHIPSASSVDLHIFCDASEKAFAAVAFLRVKSASSVEVNFVVAKTRIAPLKVLSIPRLELQAAVMGTRLGCVIREELTIDVHSTTYWTDSMTVLRWIRSDARAYKPFVAHRIGEILDSTLVSEWRHVPTKQNVADDATRNMEPSDLSQTSRWFNGPAFLKENEDMWPQEKEASEETDPHNDTEMRAVVLAMTTEPALIEFERFSRFQRIVRTMALVCRTAAGWLHSIDEEYSVLELENAEKQLVKACQQETFAEELRCLNGGQRKEGRKEAPSE